MNIYDDEVREIREVWKPELFVLWTLGNQCTYKCSYCPENLHSGTIPFLTKEVIQRLLNKLPKAHVMFTGGEATFHSDFEELVLEKPDHIDISVISNASRPIAFWERIGSKLKSVTLTYHTEFAQFDRFAATADLIYNKFGKPGKINLTMIPEKWDQCVEVYEKLVSANLRVTPKPLLEDWGRHATQVLPSYSNEQITWISEKTKFGFKSIKVLNKDGNVLYRTNQSELLSLKQTNFKDWLCYTNTQAMYIGLDRNIYMASCGQRIKIGSVNDEVFTIPTEPFICKQNFCWCHSDMSPRKIKL